MGVDHSVDHNPPFTFRKKGVFYFSRRVPADLDSRYTTRRIVLTLRTKCPVIAHKRAQAIAHRLDDYWWNLRWAAMPPPGAHFVVGASATRPEKAEEQSGTGIRLSEAAELYIRLKGVGKGNLFKQTANRSVTYASKYIGDKDISQYKKSDATKFRDHLFAKGLRQSSVRRIFSTVRSIINFVSSENGLEISNQFSGVYLGEGGAEKRRQPLPEHVIIRVQRACAEMDDDMRWLVALVSNTGMRLAEAVGLLASDLHIDAEIPHVDIRAHPWRSLKTRSSTRQVPLVGASLWAAERVRASGTKFAFPRYCDSASSRANHASAALNKWLLAVTDNNYVMHGFRHALRDRLRAVECPADVVDQIGGWSARSVGEGYGNGYPLHVLAKWLETMREPSRQQIIADGSKGYSTVGEGSLVHPAG